MTIRFIDAHCHLQFPQYDADREDVIQHMLEKGIAAVVVGVDRPSSEAAVALAERYPHLYASVGLHPTDTEEEFSIDIYRELALHPKVVAIGECGLDFFRPHEVTDTVRDTQKELFKKQIALAVELGKPLIIHARPTKGTEDAYGEVLVLLQEAKNHHPQLRGDIHFFVGGVQEARAFHALDFTVSYTAVITFAREYDEVITSIPLTTMLSETDAPYVAPLERRGQRNDPLAVESVVRKLADIRSEEFETVRETVLTTTQNLFNFSA